MKKCQGDCHRPVQEYYIMPDKKVLCYDCWKRGLERAERFSQTYRANVDKRFSDYRQAKHEYDQIGEQIRLLREKIRYEMEQAGKDRPYPNSVDDYADPSYVPYNYAKVKSMERDLEMLYKKRDALEPQTHLRSPQPVSLNDSSSIQYYQKGVYYDSVRAREYEQAEQDAKKREEERKKQEETERIARINRGMINGDDKSFIEAHLDVILPQITNEGVLIKLAFETTNEDMISYLMKSKNAKIQSALSDNRDRLLQSINQLFSKFEKEMAVFNKYPKRYYSGANIELYNKVVKEFSALKAAYLSKKSNISIADAKIVLEQFKNSELQNHLKKAEEIAKLCSKAEREWNEQQEIIRKQRQYLVAHGYVDLGLPSGTVWKKDNESGKYSSNKAMIAFGDKLPSEVQWRELIEKCQWRWNQSLFKGGSYTVIGPNGLSIIIPVDFFSMNLQRTYYSYYLSRTTGTYLDEDYDEYKGLTIFHVTSYNKKIESMRFSDMMFDVRLAF